MSTAQAKKVVKKYAKILKNNDFIFNHIYLFGSYARGNFTEDSDIDVAVIVQKNPKNSTLDLQMNAWKLTTNADIRIEPTVLEEDELDEGSFSIMGEEVRRTGILVE